MPTSSLTGRTALVTGGANGIGRACVAALRAAGATVHLVDADGAAATEVAGAYGAAAHVADLTDPAALASLPSGIDILVNNAGVQHIAPIPDFPLERFVLLQQLMVTAPFLLMQRYLPAMYEQGWGRLVNISSVHGCRASPHKAAYVAAKHALEGLSKVAAVEGAERGVTSNCVAPGYVRTDLVANQIEAQAASLGVPADTVVDEVFLRRTALGRLIEPREVAALAVWLCGDDASYVTGASLPLDGAWTAT